MKRRGAVLVFLFAVGLFPVACSGVRSGGFSGDTASALEQAESLLQEGDYLSARALFAQVERRDWRASYYGQARSLLLGGSDPRTALWYLARAYGSSSRPEAEVFFWKGLASFRIGDYLSAEDSAREALDRDPEEPYHHRLLADLYREWHNDEYARAEYEQALRYGGDRKELLFLIGWMQLRNDQTEAGRRLLEKAQREDPDNLCVDALLSLRLHDEAAFARLSEIETPDVVMTRVLSDPEMDRGERTRLLRGLVEGREEPYALWARSALEGLRTR